MTPEERLDDIQARADKATDGAWRAREVDDFDDEMPEAIEILGPGPSTVAMVSARDWDSQDDPEMVANAEFIAHARTDVSDLTAALQAVLRIDTGQNREIYGLDFEAGMCKALWLVRQTIQNKLQENT